MSGSTPMTINYQETAFTFPWDRNRQVVHDRVYQVLLDGKNIPDDQKTRLFLYDAIALDEEAELGLVTARATKFKSSVESEDKRLTVRSGDQFKVKVSLSASRQHRQLNGTHESRVYRRVPDDELKEWATALFKRNGMTPTELTVSGRRDYPVRKVKTAFGISEARVTAVITVDDAVSFAKAFLSGIGRQKGYGFGLLEIVEE